MAVLFQWQAEHDVVCIQKREDLVTRGQCYFSLEGSASEILYNGRLFMQYQYWYN
jgi:hypothetical protein